METITKTPKDFDFSAYYQELQESRCIRSVGENDTRARVLSKLENRNPGTPCDLFTRGNFSFLPGDVTIWAGQNGHGKSLLVGQIISQLMMRDERCFLMSLEMLPEYSLLRMMRQAFGHKPTVKDKDDVMRWMTWAAPKLVYFDRVGAVRPNDVLGAMAYACEIYKCRHLFIDNLMRVVPGEDTYNAQKDFMEQVCDLAMTFGVHVHLIHHVRKSEKETDEIDKFSIRGASSIADQAANIVLIQRNLRKEKEREDNALDPAKDEAEGDVMLKLCKHRNGDWQGRQPTWFIPEATAYATSHERYLPRLWPGNSDAVDEPFF